MYISDNDFDRLGPIPTEVLIENLCEIELKLDDLQKKRELIRYEILHRYKNKRLKGWKFDERNQRF
jgi:hypothetical protein